MLDLKPEDVTPEESVFQSASNAESALMGIYHTVYESHMGTAYTIGDFTTDIISPRGTSIYPYLKGEVLVDDSFVQNFWAKAYSAINVANVFVSSIPKLAKYDESIQKQHMAEAKFLRAFTYFNLLKLFGDGALTGNMEGLGVCLILKPYSGEKYDANDISPRVSNEEIYKQIIGDLKESIEDLPERYRENEEDYVENRGRATSYAAYALLSRVYLYKREYSLAAEAAKHITDKLDLYPLANNMGDLFAVGNDGQEVDIDREHIFAIPVSFNGGSYMYGGHNFYYQNKNSFVASDDYKNSLDQANDKRYTQLIQNDTDISNQNPNISTTKTTKKFTNEDNRDNIPILRSAEICLTRAECLARQNGIDQDAVSLLNKVAKRANPSFVEYKTSDFTKPTDLIDRILLERKLELAFESNYRYDMIRTGEKLFYFDEELIEDNKDKPGFNKDDYKHYVPENRYVLPIPQYEINITNGIIKQNLGYL
jgi:hypothetical protein